MLRRWHVRNLAGYKLAPVWRASSRRLYVPDRMVCSGMRPNMLVGRSFRNANHLMIIGRPLSIVPRRDLSNAYTPAVQ